MPFFHLGRSRSGAGLYARVGIGAPMETFGSIDSYGALLGIEGFEIADGEVSVVLPTSARHANLGGWIHGGVLSGLLDFALGAAVVATLEGDDEWCATQSLTTDFLRPGKPGDKIVARARVDRRGKLAAFPSGEVYGRDGEVLARATGVWAIRSG